MGVPNNAKDTAFITHLKTVFNGQNDLHVKKVGKIGESLEYWAEIANTVCRFCDGKGR